MLLRLLPIPTPSQPSPPTILFTLPLPTHPYTSRSLPLPANLLAHRSVCLQEDLECSNVLLGEKSTWVSGIVDDVTFSLPANIVTIHLIDGSRLVFPLSEECTSSLRLVIHQVQLSFAPPAPTTPRHSDEASPRTSISSVSSVASSSSSPTVSPTSRRSPSSLLYSILSPLLPGSSMQSQQVQSSLPKQAAQPPARVHRRQARSLLVDTYRQHVLPILKDTLPSAYLPWLIASETSKRMAEFDMLRDDINALLSTCGVDATQHTPMKRSRSASTSSTSTDSESETEMSPVTPATSVFSPSSCSTSLRSRAPATPQSFLLSIPPAHSVPFGHRNGYSNQLARLSKIASRLSAIKKLQGRYDREEGKRRWLESLERGRQGDRSLRRAFSNGEIRARVNADAMPIKRSGLWRSWTASEQDRYETSAEEAIHPAMMTFSSPISGPTRMSEDSEDDECPSPPRRRSISSINLPNLPDLSLEDNTDEVVDKVIIVHHGQTTRPPLAHRDAEDEVPSLVTSFSDESLAESEEWDEDRREDLDAPTNDSMTLPRPAFAQNWEANVVRMTKPDLKLAMDWERQMDVDERDPDVRVEVFNGVGVVYAS